VDVQVIAPTVGALEDWERDVRRAIRRTVNTQARARRHGVEVRAPGVHIPPRGRAKDTDFWVLSSAMPTSRRGGRHHG